jgi:hypothetical protein
MIGLFGGAAALGVVPSRVPYIMYTRLSCKLCANRYGLLYGGKFVDPLWDFSGRIVDITQSEKSKTIPNGSFSGFFNAARSPTDLCRYDGR